MKAIPLDVPDAADAVVVDVPTITELQMELRLLRRMVTWEEVWLGLRYFGGVAFPAAYWLHFSVASRRDVLEWLACYVLVLVPMVALSIWWRRRCRRVELMEKLVHELIAVTNEQRRIIARLT
jgi:hypothetical protein